MSPLSLRYANVGSFSNFSLSIYDKSLIGSYQEVLLWPFSGRFLLLFYVLSYMDTVTVTTCSKSVTYIVLVSFPHMVWSVN